MMRRLACGGAAAATVALSCSQPARAESAVADLKRQITNLQRKLEESDGDDAPLVFVIADSISLDYGPALKENLRLLGLRYGRKNEGALVGDERRGDGDQSVSGQNGGDSSHVLAYCKHLASDVTSTSGADERLRASVPSALSGTRPLVVLLNAGLHCVKRQTIGGPLQVAPARYREEMREAIRVCHRELRARHVVLVNSTPVNTAQHKRYIDTYPPSDAMHGTERKGEDVVVLNRVLEELAKSEGCPLIDLHTLTKRMGIAAYRDHVHYTPDVSQAQAAFVALELERLLRVAGSLR